jgi:thymidylate kinase
MNNILIFVGPDNSGKTEISQALSEKLNYQYYKNDTEHYHFVEDSFFNLVKYHAPGMIDFFKKIKIKEGVVLDRYTPCEYAYAKTYNRNLDEKLIFKLDEELASLNTVIIYCYKDHYEEFDDEVVELKDMKTVMKYYEEYFNKSKIPVIKIETSSEDLSKQIPELLNKLKELK